MSILLIIFCLLCYFVLYFGLGIIITKYIDEHIQMFETTFGLILSIIFWPFVLFFIFVNKIYDMFF
jgi:hypothetical protein